MTASANRYYDTSMVPQIEPAQGLRCEVASKESGNVWTMTIRPARFGYAELLLFVAVCCLTVWFGKEVWPWRKDFTDWWLIIFVGISALSLSWALLVQLTVTRLRFCLGEITVTKAILGIRRHWRIKDGHFKLVRMHAFEDFRGEPFGFQLHVFGRAGKHVRVLQVGACDQSFMYSLVEFLTEVTAWHSAEEDEYFPPVD
jgi:hypothetical protein